MTSLQSLQSKALQLVSEEEQSYESTMLTSPLPCESSIKMEDLLEDGEIWLEDLAGGESPHRNRGSHPTSSDTLVLPPRRRLSFGSRRNSGNSGVVRELRSNFLAFEGVAGGRATTRRTHSMDEHLLSQSTGALDCCSTSAVQHSTCFLRTRALSVGAIDIASWKLTDRCRRRSKGSSTLQEASKSVRALPREAELVEQELNDSIMMESSHKQVPRRVSKSRSKSPGNARRSGRRSSIYGSLEERLSKSTGAIEFSETASLPQRTCLVGIRRALSVGASESRSSSKLAAAVGGANERRRMPKEGKHLLLLQGVSPSVRALPRETEMETSNPDLDHLEDSFQAIFETIADIDTKVRYIKKEFAI